MCTKRCDENDQLQQKILTTENEMKGLRMAAKDGSDWERIATEYKDELLAISELKNQNDSNAEKLILSLQEEIKMLKSMSLGTSSENGLNSVNGTVASTVIQNDNIAPVAISVAQKHDGKVNNNLHIIAETPRQTENRLIIKQPLDQADSIRSKQEIKDQYRLEIEDLTKNLEEKSLNLDLTKMEVTKYHNDLNQLSIQLEDKNKEIVNLNSSFVQKDAENHRLCLENQELRNKYEEIDSALTKMQLEHDMLSHQCLRYEQKRRKGFFRRWFRRKK